MLQKYFDKIILESIFYYTLQNSSQKQEAEQEKIFEIHLNWKLTNVQFKIQWICRVVVHSCGRKVSTANWEDLTGFS